MRFLFEKKNYYLYIFLAVSLGAGLLISTIALSVEVMQTVTINTSSSRVPRWLDGVQVQPGFDNLRPVAVVIENHAASRPSAGIDQASIVYETVVEGDITRFLAIFDQQELPDVIGPVRSARPFLVDLAEEWDAVFFHAGGSDAALIQLRQSFLSSINEISSDGKYFFRSRTRFAPHNLFTSGSHIRKALEEKNISTTTTPRSWHYVRGMAFPTVSPPPEPVAFSGNSSYVVRFEYLSERNQYRRFLAGEPHRTEDGNEIIVDNVIVQKVEYRVIDSYGRLELFLTKGGPAGVYRNGTVTSGSWKYVSGRTVFLDENHNEIQLNRGKTWIVISF